MDEYQLTGTTDNIEEFLDAVALRIGALRHQGKRDHDAAAFHFVKAFRSGKFGKFILDDLSQEGIDKRRHDIDEARFWSHKRTE